MMKKILTILVMAISTIATTYAQDVFFGVKGGGNLTNMYFSAKNLNDGNMYDKIQTKNKLSFHIGAFAEFEFVERLYGEVGLQYTNNGFTVSNEDKITVTLNQINMPLSLKYEVVEDFRVKGGFYAGYVMSEAIKEGKETVKAKFDIENEIDYGLTFGVEYILPSGIFFDMNYNYGLKDLERSDLITLKNSVFQLGVGYRF